MEILPYACQWIDEDDISAVASVLRGPWLTQGPTIVEFEKRVATFCGASYAVAFSSGTAALHGAAAAADLRPGDEWVTCPLSFVASANACLYAGGTPRFVDIEPGGFTMDPAALANIISKRTRVVVPVGYAGHPAEMDEITALAKHHGILVVEDACHSLGAEYRGRRCGTQADMTVFSFHPVKHLATGEGGMILTERRDFYEKLLRFRSHGIDRSLAAPDQPWFYDMVELGYNYRLTDIQCALGISQISKLEGFLKRRREIAQRYDDAFSGLRNAHALKEKEHVRSARHLYVLQIQFCSIKKDRSQVMAALRERGVGSQVHYRPIHLQTYYREHFGFRPGDFPGAEAFYEGALSLPLYPKMSDKDVDRVVEAVFRVIG